MVYIDSSTLDVQVSWLTLVVKSDSNVTYWNQCGGHGCEQKWLEGFVIPMMYPELAREIEGFFQRYNCWPPTQSSHWQKEDIVLLDLILGKIHWARNTLEYFDGSKGEVEWNLILRERPEDKVSGEEFVLALDLDMLDDSTEGWLWVQTPYGSGVLMFNNCD